MNNQFRIVRERSVSGSQEGQKRVSVWGCGLGLYRVYRGLGLYRVYRGLGLYRVYRGLGLYRVYRG